MNEARCKSPLAMVSDALRDAITRQKSRAEAISCGGLRKNGKNTQNCEAMFRLFNNLIGQLYSTFA